jgi:hypothetical protein
MVPSSVGKINQKVMERLFVETFSTLKVGIVEKSGC